MIFNLFQNAVNYNKWANVACVEDCLGSTKSKCEFTKALDKSASAQVQQTLWLDFDARFTFFILDIFAPVASCYK